MKHAVWPTGIPYVHNLWTQGDWDRFAEGYRPKGYTGGIHDADAREAYRAVERKRERLALLRAFRPKAAWIEQEISILEQEL